MDDAEMTALAEELSRKTVMSFDTVARVTMCKGAAYLAQLVLGHTFKKSS